MKTKIRLRQRRGPYAGFSTFELAIILAIIGVILGGIWAAARNASESQKLTRAIDELEQINSNIRAFYASQDVTYNAQLKLYPSLNATPASTPAILGAPGADFCHFTPLMQLQGIFPYDTLVGTAANNPWNKTTSLCSGVSVGSIETALAGTAGSPVDYVIRFIGVPSYDCTQFLMRNALPGPETKLDGITVTWLNANPGLPPSATTTYKTTGTTPCTAGGTCFLPPAINDATVGCPTASGTLIMDFRYQLGD